MTAPELVRILLEGRYHSTQDELRLQDEMDEFLTQSGIAHEREVRLSATDRLDFLVGSVAVEVKVKGSPHAVIRQLLRYAEHEQVTELVLFTTRSQLVVPKTLGGKPALVARYTTL